MTKLMSMRDAVSRFVGDSSSLYISGFTHLIDFSAAHEIIRQRKKNLTLMRMTPDIIYDQMVAAGVSEKLVFSYLGNPGVGSLRCIRRAIEKGLPNRPRIEEYTHGSLISALYAGGSSIPFFPVPSVGSTDLQGVNNKFANVTDPFTGNSIAVVRAIKPDTAIIHVQRADSAGNAQIWGIIGEQKEAAFASRNVIVTAEEIVDKEVIKSDPNRTLIPSFLVSAVVPDPWGAHPSYAQGFYDRDNEFYLRWDKISQDEHGVDSYLNEWVYGINDREEYLSKIGKDRLEELKMKERKNSGINYGSVA